MVVGVSGVFGGRGPHPPTGVAINNCCMNKATSGQDIEANDCQRTQITEQSSAKVWGVRKPSTASNAQNCAIKNNA